MRIIRNYDVSSYYPSLMIHNGYTSRSVESFDKFKQVYETRLKAKADGDKNLANILKLILNTTYGATLDRFNDLYDPLMARSVCITGQLYLLELAQHLHMDIPGLECIGINTDGLMVQFDDCYYDAVTEIVNEWQSRTHMGLQEDKISGLWQKDVNNYVMRFVDGHSKTKGAYFKSGISAAGAFSVNNDYNIVKIAVRDYFLYDTPVEDTIWECEDPKMFQIIAKGGSKYSRVYWMLNGEAVTVQRCNRVYATGDIHCGTLYKTHKETGRDSLIAGLPQHCLIDNEGLIGIGAIDKNWYVELAKKRISDFIGTTTKRRGKKMATANKMNLFQKLLEARVRMAQSGLTKDGKNMMLAYKYFTLDDIVNKSTPIFKDLGLLPVTFFENEYAYLHLYDADAPDVTPLKFSSPMRPGVVNKGVTEIQSLGGVETYQRRYLLMAVLDIVQGEEDPDSGIVQDMGEKVITPVKTEVKVEAPKKAPPTAEERKEVKEQLTAVDGTLDEVQLKALKSAMSKLRSEKPDQLMWIMEVAKKTEGFTKLTKADADALIVEIGQRMK